MAASFTPKTTQPVLPQATILNTANISDIQSIKGYTIVALLMPSVWTAASLTVQVSYDGTNFFDLHAADGTEYTFTVAASQAIVVPPGDFAAISYIKLRSGTSGSPVTQLQDSIITIVAAKL